MCACIKFRPLKSSGGGPALCSLLVCVRMFIYLYYLFTDVKTIVSKLTITEKRLVVIDDGYIFESSHDQYHLHALHGIFIFF